jgi:DNA-binding MarR family transcriptional regulator
MMTIKRHDGASLSQMAEHLGATVSSASKIVEALVERGLIARATDADDRRKLALALTDEGEALMASAHLRLLTVLAEKLSSLSPNECAMVELAMGIVRSALAQARTTSSEE